MRVAVIGAGIAGLGCAAKLAAHHEVSLFEANNYLGGHANTVDVTLDGLCHPVDTGFLVYNERTYPNLIELFTQLGVQTLASDMSFSVRLERGRRSALEWAGTNLNTVFAQRRNLVSPRFLRMLADLLRFNAMASSLAAGSADASKEISLGEFLEKHGFSETLRDWYLLPMAAAIWSCSTAQMLEFPLATFVRFCHNHGLLQVNDRPQWFTVRGGSREYVRRLAKACGTVRMARVEGVQRSAIPGGATAVRAAGVTEYFDHVVLACHSDQALRLLDDASDEERALLGAIRYQANRAVLHCDASLLPQKRLAWAAWNYEANAEAQTPNERAVAVHYLINRLQPVPFRRPVLVSLNPIREPERASILAQFDYEHPVFDHAAIAAQARLEAIQGDRNTWFAGAWTGYGFHEDGLKSGLLVAGALLADHTRASAIAA